jgi:hypothetical protein
VRDTHIRPLRHAARRAHGQVAEYSPRDQEGAGSAAHRRADLERSAQRAAARLAAAEATRRRGPETYVHKTKAPSELGAAAPDRRRAELTTATVRAMTSGPPTTGRLPSEQ